ncbi:MAG: EAL domain-containing protein [Xanthomonadales bacterium]|nr:EAL domain-containing protein [Xanthomonadales bacterium]
MCGPRPSERAPAAARSFREQLARHGVRFCLSGFDGSERAFELLEVFPAEWVRLGRLGSADQPATREQLAHIVERCHRLGREVVAPRVEEADEAALAWTAGVDYIQGNFVHAGSGEPEFDFHHLA